VKKFREFVPLVLYVIAATGIRLLLLLLRSQPSSEEVWALFLVAAPFKTIWFATFADLHGPFYFLLLRLLKLIWPFDFTVFSLRLISFFFDLLATFGVWYLGRFVLGKRVGRISFVVSLFLPAFIWPSVFARYYPLLILLFIVSMVLFIHFLRFEKNKSLLALLLCLVVGMYTHYYFALVIASFGIFLLLSNKYRHLFIRWFIAMLIVVLMFAPGLYYFLTLPKPTLIDRHENSWLKIPAIITTNIMSSETLIFLFFRGNRWVYLPVIAILTLLTVAFVVQGLLTWKNELRKLFTVVLIVPPLITILFAYTVAPLLSLGSLQIFMPALIIVLAQAIAQDGKKILTLVFAATVFCSLVFLFQTSIWFYAKPRKDFTNFIRLYKAGDIVLHTHLGSFFLASYYVGKNVNFEIEHGNTATAQTAAGVDFRPISDQQLFSHVGGIWYFEPPFIDPVQSANIKSKLSAKFTLVHTEKFPRSEAAEQETFYTVYYYK